MQTISATLRGDYYEIRGEQAVAVARILGITRQTVDGLPFCAIPRHCRASYAIELESAGFECRFT